MALVLQDRVKENSLSSGTGSVVLAGAYTGYRTFASCIPNGSTTYYCIHNLAPGYQNEWEVGIGTYTLSTTTLSRDTVLSSSAGGAKVNFTSGSGGLEVFITYPAEKSIYEEANGTTLINAGPIAVIGNNVTSYTSFTAALGEMYGNVDNYAQLYVQNLNGGTEASADFAAYNDASDGETFFVDMGISSTGSSSNVYPILGPNTGYVISYGDGGSNVSNLLLGSGDGDTVIFAGSFDTNATVATFGSDLSTTLEGSLDVGSTLNVTGVTTLNALAYTAGNIAAAANNTVLVTKQYVDDATSNGFHVHTPVLVATTGNLTANYNNGSSGVGATLTNSGTQVALSIDGVSMNVNDRVLVWQQTSGLQNGVYVVTTVGNGSTNWVLTRAADADTAGENNPDELGGGDYFFVQSGNTLGYHSFICTNTGTITFGTTAITFSEFSQVPTYTGGTNINISGQTISLTGTVAPTNGGTGVNTVATGDLLYGSASNTWSKLALGSAYKSLVVNGSGTQVEWNAVALNQSGAVSGSLGATNGGTGQSGYAVGDTLYSSATDTLAKLAGNTTTTKKFLSQVGNGSASAAPAWEQPAASDITGLAASATTDTTNASNISSGTLANARTTASSSNGANTIVARDASGNFSANTITANVTGNISGSAATLSTPRNFQISGGATAANVAFDGSAAVNLNVTAINASVINSGTIPNANTTASSSNGANTIVARDASGNFTANNVSASFIIADGSALTALNASVLSSGTVPSARMSGSYTGITGVGTLTAGTWNASAISDTYLSTISTAGKVSNSATTASSSNGASTIVARDASGNFSANTITATLSGNASTATNLSTNRTNWSTNGTITAVVGQLAWKNYSNNHTIFDASNSTAPDGTAINNTNAQVAWSSSYPTLMGWNGSNTYGVRVDSARVADSATSATTFTSTSQNSQFNSVGVGTAASGTSGEIRATNNITAYFSSDAKFKENVRPIDGALTKVAAIGGKYFDWTDEYINAHGGEDGYFVQKADFGVIAQDVQAVFPQAVRTRPDGSLAVDYEKLSALAFAAIVELKAEIDNLKGR